MAKLTLFLSLLIAVPLAAQQVMRPGDSAFTPARVRLGIDTIVVLVTHRDSSEHLVSTLVRRVERQEAYGQTIYRETQRYQAFDGTSSLDTLDVSARTLAPVRYFTSSTSGGWSDVRIDGVHVTGEGAGRDSVARHIDSTATEPFLVGMMNEAFVAAYPLAPGTAITVPLANPPAVAIRRIQLTVTGTETIRTAKGPVECLVVQGPGNTVSWIARDDGRIVRLHWTLADGTSIWKLPPRDAAFR